MMKYLLDEFSENEGLLQAYYSPFSSIKNRQVHKGQHETAKAEYFNSFMLSFRSNLLSSVVLSLTSDLGNILI